MVRLATSVVKLADSLLNEHLRRVVTLRSPLLVGRIAAAPKRRIFPVRRGAVVLGCGVGCGMGADSDRHGDAPNETPRGRLAFGSKSTKTNFFR